MIITGKKSVPYTWLLMIALPVAALRFASGAMGQSFVFSLKKFTDNPALLNLVISLPSFVVLAVGPIVGYVSDRIWTRFGRRKPFLVVSWVGMSVSIFLLPLMPNFWLLVVAYIAFNLFQEIGNTYEPLRQEIVPPHQRGRGGAAFEWFATLTNTLFFFVAFGRFDDVRYLSGLPINGETAIYWSGGLVMLVAAIIIILAVRETRPPGHPSAEKLSIKGFFIGLFDRDLWPVYILVFGQALLNSGLGPLGTLVAAEVFNFSKQDQGNNVVIGGMINLMIIGVLGIVADKMNRLKAYQILIGAALVVKMFYYVYIEYILPDKRATVLEAIVFGEALSIIGILTGLIYVPLAYDYVVRNKMGIYFAGSGMISRLTALITTSTVGLFVWGYSLVFQPPAGEMVRVTVNQPVTQEVMAAELAKATWTIPESGSAPGKVHADSWRASGPRLEQATTWEIRLKDPASETLGKEKEDLIREQSKIGGDHAEAARLKEIDQRLAEIEAVHKRRADDFRAQLLAHLGDRIIHDNDSVLHVGAVPVRLLEYKVLNRPRSAQLESALDDLRRAYPEIVDLRATQQTTGGFHLVLSVQAGTEGDAPWGVRLASAMNRRQAEVLPSSPEVSVARTVRALDLRLRTIEEPLDLHPSPITRAGNIVLGWFGHAPVPERRVLAIARSLRDPATLPHVRATAIKDPHQGIAVLALAGEQGTALLEADGTTLSSAGRAFMDEVVKQAAVQRLTLAKGVLASGYVPMKYDYMSGYLMMFFLGLIGLAITFVFVRMEKSGRLRKLGREEAEALNT